MKHAIHPQTYRDVVLRDRAAGFAFRTRSTVATTQTITWEGQELPLVEVQISSASHPYWTGQKRVLDQEGRVEKFYRKFGAGA